MKRTEIVCHKGANEVAPENTYAAAQCCLDWGADYVEIDVNRSADGVHYLLHGPSVAETTNGTGNIGDLTATQIDALDAGSWFSPDFAGERVPRLEPFLRWIKGKAKVYFDIKAADLPTVIELVRELQMEGECFFWFGDDAQALALRQLAPDLALKINAASVADVITAHELYGAALVEVALKDMSQALVAECRRRGLRVMIYHPKKQPLAFRQVLRWGADLVNLDHADLFMQVAQEVAAASTSEVNLEPPLPQAKRVILFMLDGCRADAIAQAATPQIDQLCRDGAWTLTAQSVMPSITLPCHTSLFHAVPPAAHSITSNEWQPLATPAPSLFRVIAEHGYDTAAFYTWEQLRDLAPPGALDTVEYRRLSWDNFAELEALIPAMLARQLPTFAFVYLEATDAIGHLYGWMSQAYLHTLTRSDAIIGTTRTALAAVGAWDETLCIVMADHGGHGRGHGTDAPEDMTVPLILQGPCIAAGHLITRSVTLMDVAPTILYALGIPIPQTWQGQVIQEVFIP